MASKMSKEEARLRLLLHGIDPDTTPAPGKSLETTSKGVPSATSIENNSGKSLVEKLREINPLVFGGEGKVVAKTPGTSNFPTTMGTLRPDNSRLAGAAGTGLASVASGGALPAAIIGAGIGSTSTTPGQAAASTALAGVPFGKVVGKGSRAMQIIRGLAGGAGMGVGAEALQHGIDEQRLPTGKEAGTAGVLGGVLGAAPPLAAKILESPKLTPYKQYLADLFKHKTDSIPLEQNKINTASEEALAKNKVAGIKDDAKAAKDALAAAFQQDSIGKTKAQKSVLAVQYQHAADLEAARSERRIAQDAADAAQEKLKSHIADLNGKATEAQKATLADLKQKASSLTDQAVAKQNALARLHIVQRDEAGPVGRIVSDANVPGKKLGLTVSLNNLKNAAAKTKAGIGVDVPTFEHAPEDISKLSDLQDAYGSAIDNVNSANQRIDSIKQAKAQHRASAAAATPSSTIDSSLIDNHDKASAALQDALDEARAKSRDAIEAKRAVDLHDTKAPQKVEKSLMDNIREVTKGHGGTSAAIGTLAEELARHSGAGMLSLPIGAAASTAATIMSPGVEAAKKFVAENLLAHGASALPGIPQATEGINSAGAGLVDRLRAILGGSAQASAMQNAPAFSVPDVPVDPNQ